MKDITLWSDPYWRIFVKWKDYNEEADDSIIRGAYLKVETRIFDGFDIDTMQHYTISIQDHFGFYRGAGDQSIVVRISRNMWPIGCCGRHWGDP